MDYEFVKEWIVKEQHIDNDRLSVDFLRPDVTKTIFDSYILRYHCVIFGFDCSSFWLKIGPAW